MANLPIFLKTEGRTAVIVGGGEIGRRKMQLLAKAAIRIKVIEKEAGGELKRLAGEIGAEVVNQPYQKELIEGAAIVIAATDDRQLNERIAADCRDMKILCNVVDCPELCDFYMPAVIRRKDLITAIGTTGKCPALASSLREKLEGIITEEYGEFLEELDKLRSKVLNEFKGETAGVILRRLAGEESFQRFCLKGKERWRDWSAEVIGEYKKS